MRARGSLRPAFVLALGLPALAVAQPTTTRVSVSSLGVQGNGDSWSPAISDDGRWVAFRSLASNLVPGDTNLVFDVFLHDRQTGTTTRVSVGPGGVQGNGASLWPAISADGRFVAFASSASNLVANDTNNLSDVFVHDRDTGVTTRVSVDSAGAQANAGSSLPAISADGRSVAFVSPASNLSPNDTNGVDDIFVHDRTTGSTSRVSVGTGGLQANGASAWPDISADGRRVSFESFASNLVTGDTNGTRDIFLHDRSTTTTTRVSVSTTGVQGNALSQYATVSGNGRFVTFESLATNLVPGDPGANIDVFVHDHDTGNTSALSFALGGGLLPSISPNGRWVAFEAIVNTQKDVFLHDRQTGISERVSVRAGGGLGNASSSYPSIGSAARWPTFRSSATDLVPDDTNGEGDVFVRDLGTGTCSVTLVPGAVSVTAAGGNVNILVLDAFDCAWTALSSDPAWLGITGGSNGSGFGVISLAIAPNAGSGRNGTITVGTESVTVQQSGTAPSVPMPPSGVAVHTMNGPDVTLRWSVPPGGATPTGFVLEGGINPGEVLASLPTGSTDPTFTFTAPTGSFYVRVHALNGAVRSAASNEIRIHVNVAVAPSAPANLLGLVNGSTVALAWTNTYAGGAPTSLVLDVAGALVTSLPLGLTDGFSFAGVPAGAYTLALRAQNAAGTSPQSNAVTLTFPGPCTGAPLTPTNLLAYRVGNTVFVDWAPATSGPAPTGYRLDVTGAFVGSFATAARAMSGTVGPGAYTLSVVATNACGVSSATAPQTVVVP